jgi:hypothetical protein
MLINKYRYIKIFFKLINIFNFISFLNKISEIYMNNSEDELTVVLICFFTVFILVGYIYFRNYKKDEDNDNDNNDGFDIFD